MLGIPLAAMAVLAVFLSFNALGSSKQASAAGPGAVEFTLHVGAADTALDAKGNASVAIGSQFAVSASIDVIPGPYDAIAFTVNYTAPLQGEFENSAKPGSGAVITGHWPDCAFQATAPNAAGFQNVGCSVAASVPVVSSVYLGDAMATTLTCATAGTGTVSLLHGVADTLLLDAGGKTYTDNGPDVINIDCLAATNTPTPLPTATPPPIPRVQKDCDAVAPGVQNLCNVFLQRNDTKIPPVTCNEGTSLATLTETINQSPVTQNPKGEDQDLAAFEFEVRFDHTKVCVNLAPAAQWVTAGAICIVQDKDSSTLEGIARIGCVTQGKGVNTDGLELAIITVRPQPEVYSQLRPNQDNGNAVQILNQACELADEQGHAIPIFSCEDADITFRFLEGDVDGPDCDVDVFDTQQVAFRWGVNKGSLLYNSFMDLEPSGQVKGDGDIDIKDIQFVFGRFGSTGSAQKGDAGPCPAVGNPWPPQEPQNPKAVSPPPGGG
jgi:hypothetical protein